VADCLFGLLENWEDKETARHQRQTLIPDTDATPLLQVIVKGHSTEEPGTVCYQSTCATPRLGDYSSFGEPAEGFPNLQSFFLSPAPLPVVSLGPSLALPAADDAPAASAELLVQACICAAAVLRLALVEVLRLALLVKLLVEIRVSSVEVQALALLVEDLFEYRESPVEVLRLVLLLASAAIRGNNLYDFQSALQTSGQSPK
jgi:hypothetical protein